MLSRKWMEGPGRMRIGVDICNTIANVNAEILKCYHVSLDVYPFPELPAGFFSTTEGLTLLARAKPLAGAAEVLKNYALHGHEIIYITSRPVIAANITREWLATHDFPRGSIVFLPRGYKKVFAAHYGIGLFFEDDPVEATGLHEAVGQVYMPAWCVWQVKNDEFGNQKVQSLPSRSVIFLPRRPGEISVCRGCNTVLLPV